MADKNIAKVNEIIVEDMPLKIVKNIEFGKVGSYINWRKISKVNLFPPISGKYPNDGSITPNIPAKIGIIKIIFIKKGKAKSIFIC